MAHRDSRGNRSPRLSWVLFVCAFLVVIILPNRCEASFSRRIRSREEFCMAVRTPRYSSIGIPNVKGILSGNFEVVEKELDPVPFRARVFETDASGTILSNKPSLWESRPSESFDAFRLDVQVGSRYLLCLDNGSVRVENEGTPHRKLVHVSDGKTRTVGFHVRVHSIPAATGPANEKEGGLLHDKAEPVVELSFDLLDKLSDVLDHWEYLKMSEEGYHLQFEDSIAQMRNWHILLVLVVALVSVLQVRFIVKVVERRKRL